MIDPITLTALSAAMDAASMRQRAGALNLANANTPGYQPQRVAFESAMEAGRGRLQRGARLREEDIATARLETASVAQTLPAGAPSVALDQEVAALSLNALQYQALAKSLSGQFALVDTALTDGRR